MALEHLGSAGCWGGPRTDSEVRREEGWEGRHPGAVATGHASAVCVCVCVEREREGEREIDLRELLTRLWG